MTTMPQRESTIAAPDDGRKQLGAFLRARRESLDPQRLGLPRVGRRRTPGLRREEVAMLAEVGVTWYTWLEQGREVNPSAAVLVSVANALQCKPAGDPTFVCPGRTDAAGSRAGHGMRRHQPRQPGGCSIA
ncbi:DNA-binding protein [Klebsiella michiganensis]|uniref:DNA-binding protein n=1 Tax=Klebsiella michiganensis TaxID=1134687 RepID=A0A7H4N5E5_9ENTR|nr:DNA-binding protein [Klebsiella michiganensis]